MRILFFTLLFFVFSFFTKAQSWFDVGAKAGFGISQLYNANIWENRDVVNKLSYAYNFGGKIGYNFNPKYQVTLDFIYGQSEQVYEFNNETSSFDKTLTFKEFNIPLLFRFNNNTGNYFEIGPQINFLGKFTEESNGQTEDINTYFNPINYSAVAGMGAYFLGNKNLYLLFGFRVHVGLNDILSSEGGQNSNNDFYPVMDKEVDVEFSEYKSTIPFTLSLNMEINFDLGYIARSNCKRSAFMLFK